MTSDQTIHVLVVGAGAVGCFYASRLHHPQDNVLVSLTARSNYSVIAEAGVVLETHSFGDYTFRPHAVFPSVQAATPRSDTSATEPTKGPPAGGWDYIVVTTKALPDKTDDAAMIAPLVSPKSCIVLIQNGVGVEDPYRSRFPENPIVSGVTIVSAEQIKQGTIRQNRWTRMSLGPYGHGLSRTVVGTGEGDKSQALLERATRCMNDLTRWWTELGKIKDVEPHTEMELQTIRWHKLCINAAFNPTAVLSGGRGNADIVTDTELREHVASVMQEIWDAAPRVLGQAFDAKQVATPERIIKSNERNKGSKPSMLLDWEAGRPMELEVILGNPVRIARAAGVSMPRLQSTYAMLKSMQAVREERAAAAAAVSSKSRL